MQLVDWFEAFNASFTCEELSQDPKLIKAAMKGKIQLIDTLEIQIANLRAFNGDDSAAAKTVMGDAAAQKETAMANFSGKYTALTISAVKLALELQ